MNKNLYLLSVIAAVFLPLGFLTGLLGINVGGVPGVDDPSAFWIFSGFLSVVVALQILLFKRWNGSSGKPQDWPQNHCALNRCRDRHAA